MPSFLDNNVIILIDNKSEGIEAYLSLDKEQMTVFGRDEELLDQFGHPIYGPLVLFYPKNGISPQQRSQKLKKSLSQVLTLFYPLAGRTNNNFTVECNDDGVHFIEARVHGFLSNFLQKPNSNLLHRFLLMEMESRKAGTGPLFLVQASFFDCGGLAIGTCLWHKLGDETTTRLILKYWSAIALGHHDHADIPCLDSASQFPAREFSIPHSSVVFERTRNRFVLDAWKIAALKAKVSSASVPKPTRVEAVSALIWRSAMAAWRSSNKGIAKKSVLTHNVNIRKLAEPPLPENSMGNLIAFWLARTDEKLQSQRDMKGLVVELRKVKKKFSENEAKRLGILEVMFGLIKEAGETRGQDDTNSLIFTTLCNFGLYGVDFGWGKPMWVTVPNPSHKNLVTMMNTRDGDGGVEFWLCLSEEDMALFERDPQLLEFASPNPSLLPFGTLK
ncbi:hypothetical protein FEM48_Zijuj10G0040300 [Ziziphus jujuba var. spinosa]|uniref:Vinorine synthase-like n=1 Tax=Ziziphus jujuba var. spinosa TaxID=714518 RepID=A0A978UL64_ZIZJJ|nr:hypothetical protein FEM48_Zijuj10G0040300 [Ziziphus jujuba var. spinosa]